MAGTDPETPTLPTFTELPAGLRLLAQGKSVAVRHHDDAEFLPVMFPERVWQESNYDLRYHVFTSESERVTIPAISAIDAITKSGVNKPFKIMRGSSLGEAITGVIQAGRLVPADQPDSELPQDTSDAEPSESAEGVDNTAPETVVPTVGTEAADAEQSEVQEETS